MLQTTSAPTRPVPPPAPFVTGTVNYQHRGDEDALDFTFFVACYNEEQNIVGTLEAIEAAVAPAGRSYEIIVIDDASRDRSVEVVEAFQRRQPRVPIRLVCNIRNRGLAYNFVEAAFLGKGTYFKLICGDNVEDSADLARIVRLAGTADLVLPYHQQCAGKSPFRSFLSRLFTRLVNLVSGQSVRYYNGMALYRRRDVMRWHSRACGFGFQADLVTRLLSQGCSYLELETQARERIKGSSRALTIKNGFSVARTLLDILSRRVTGA